MEVQLNDLVKRLKEDGISEAKRESDRLISEAETRAKEIIDNAHKEATKELNKSREEAIRLEKSGKAALSQAARDLILDVNSSLENILKSVVSGVVNDTYNDKIVEKAITDIVSGWIKEGDEYTIKINDKLNASIGGKLKEKLAKGVTIEPSPDVKVGFLFQEKNGSAYYDFSANTIAEMLSTHLNESFRGILKASTK